MPPDADGLRGLADRLAGHGEPVSAAIESMNGARFVHDQLELAGWDVEIADAQKVKGLAPLAAKTDRIDAWVLAELARRDLVPAIWLPDSGRARRARAGPLPAAPRAPPHRPQEPHPRHASSPSATPCPVSRPVRDARPGAARTARDLPEPWAADAEASLALIDELDREIDACEAELRALGADHPLRAAAHDRRPASAGCSPTRSPPRSATSSRFAHAKKLAGYTGLCPRVRQSGGRDRRGPLAKNGPKLPALGAHRGGHARRAPPRLPRRATSAPSSASAGSAAPRSPASTSPASSPRRSGTCSPSDRALRPGRSPAGLWSHDDPRTEMDRRSNLPSNLVLPTRRR